MLLLSVLLHSTCIITVIVTCAAVALICTVTVTRIVIKGVTFIVHKKIVFTVTIDSVSTSAHVETYCAAIMTILTRVTNILLFIPT